MEATTKPRARPQETLRHEDGVEFIRLWFTDILGQLKSFAVGARSSRGAGRGHGLRRLLDHRLQPDRGVGHDRHARPGHIRGASAADGQGATSPGCSATS